MDTTQLVLLITLACIAVFSVPTARASLKKDQVVGGSTAVVFHFIGVACYLGVLPGALLGTLLVGFWEVGLKLGLLFLGLSLLALLAYAAVELPARTRLKPAEDRGWTAEDALSSGL